MVESNKILTVSYGTFSCTLEGFDDAFDTMKAIAEYFRDLAADDRYFGAEPPTPDADMLARLAERNTSRRVNARTEEGNIVLSPDQAAATRDAAGTEAPAPATEPQPAAPETAAAPAAQPEPAPREETQIEAEDVAEDEMPPRPLRAPRIAAALAAAGDAALLASDPGLAPVTEAPEAPAPAYDPPSSMAPVDEAPEADDAAYEDVSFEAETAESEPHEAPSGPVAPEPEATPEDEAEVVAETDAPALEATTDELTADAISADAEAPAEVPEAADAEAPDATPEAPATVAEAAPVMEEPDLTPAGDGWDSIAEAEEAIAIARAEPDDGEELPPASLGPTDVALKLQRIRDVVSRRRAAAELPDPAAPAVEAPATEAPATEAPEAEGISAPLSLDPQTRVADEAPASDTFVSDAAPETAPEMGPEIIPETGLETEAAPDAAAQPARPMARVIKVKRRDAAESSLSPEQEDELQRELAQIEAGVEDAPRPASPARSLRDTDHGAQMDRILRETDHHFEQEDSTRRRSALAHLRAAVAAKKAEREAGSDFAPREDTTDAYREDLAQVVRPRRPAIAHQSNSPSRRGTARPAPLKLVAEQRIDTGSSGQGPVRPRRVSIADLARAEDPAPEGTGSGAPEESFAEYAASVGARNLSEMLEAAASYMSFMEHQPLFSRPQLMSRVKSLHPEGFTREDGLRAFGQLLREGKIRKAEAGRFSVSDQIGFRPEERAVG